MHGNLLDCAACLASNVRLSCLEKGRLHLLVVHGVRGGAWGGSGPLGFVHGTPESHGTRDMKQLSRALLKAQSLSETSYPVSRFPLYNIACLENWKLRFKLLVQLCAPLSYPRHRPFMQLLGMRFTMPLK